MTPETVHHHRNLPQDPLYHLPPDAERVRVVVLVAVSAFFALAFALLGGLVLSGRAIPNAPWLQQHGVELFGIAILAATGPYGFHYARRVARVRELEDRFPEFLRALAAGRRAGMTLEASVIMVCRGDYGALTPEIRRMADQLSWNMSFEDALAEFARRVRTPLVERTVSLIIEASRTGGRVADVLQAAAADAYALKHLKDERHATMRVYGAVVYMGFLVFLVIVAVLYLTLVPELVGTSASVQEAGPSETAFGIAPGVQTYDYRVFYAVAALAQAVGNGLVAGLLGSGRWGMGLPHIFLMTLIGTTTFWILG